MRVATFAFFLLSTVVYAQDTKVTWLDEPGRLLTAGQQSQLRVQLTDSSDAPAAGVEVTFSVPSSGPSGNFVDNEGTVADKTIKVTSGEDGIATATLQAGTQSGPYLVYVQAAGIGRGTTFGIANVPARTPAPALSASAARRTLESKLPAAGAVYGPVWIPSLTAVVAAGPASVYAASTSFTTSATGSWLFWVDQNPDQLFGHSVQYVIVDAARNDATLASARFSRELWWPSVKLLGAATTVQLLPWPSPFPGAIIPASRVNPTPEAGASPCGILLTDGSGAPTAANAMRISEVFARLNLGTVWVRERERLGLAVSGALDQRCSTVYIHITAHGYPPRLPRPDNPGASLGGIVLAGPTGAPTDFIEYTDLAKMLLPLKGVARVQLIIEAPYAGNAIAAFSGLGLNGDIVAGADESSPVAITTEGTLFSAYLARSWQAAIDAGRTFDLGQLQTSSEFKLRYAKITPDGPKVLPLPNFSLAGTSQMDRATITVPNDLSAGSTVSAKVSIADPRIAEIDPLTGSAAPGRDLPPITVFASGPGVTTYSVQLTAGNGSTPVYQGKGTVTVGQEVSCTPSRIHLMSGYTVDLKIAPGAFYDRLFNGTQFTARLLDDLKARLSTAQVTLGDATDFIRLSGFAPGLTSLEITGTRGWGQRYTACIVEVNVVPETGDGTINATTFVGQTDATMQRITPQVRVQSGTVNDVAISGDLVCMTGSGPFYGGIGTTVQAPQQSLAGKLDAQTSCFWPAGQNLPVSFRFSTLFGGREIDTPSAVVPDSRGNVWVIGYTESPDLPITDRGRRYVGKQDIFIAKISRFGDRILHASYLGGGEDDIVSAAAVDQAGDLYLTGYTVSRNFPITGQPFQGAYEDGADVFVTKINGDTGALIYSTLYGSRGDDIAYGIAVDAQGSAYIAGRTTSLTLPVSAGSFQPVIADGPPCLQVGTSRPCPDAFVAKFSPDGSALTYATFLGGSDNDYAFGITVDPAGNAIVVGATSSTNFPVKNPVQPALSPGICFGLFNCQDAFVAILNPSGTALVASTYVGGSGVDEAANVALDATGNVYIFGRTNSTNFPATGTAFSKQFRGGTGDAFLGAFSPGLKSILGLTYVGSSGDDQTGGLAVTPDGKVFFGLTLSEKDLRIP